VLRRLLPATCALALAAAACGRPNIVARAQEPQGPSWFSLVVDTEQNSGAGLSLATDADGNPHLAYLAFPEEPPPGEEAPAPDPLAPKLPAVMHAHLVQDVWTRGPVAEEQKADDTNTTAIAVDADGVHHVAWTTSEGVSYASNVEGDFGDAEVVASAPASGVSIAVGEDGTPWIAYYEELGGAEGPAALVRVATPGKRGWEVQTAAEAGPADPASTGIGVTSDGPVVAYGSEGRTLVARQQGSRWVSETVDQDGGVGVSLAVDADGAPHLSYATEGGAVKQADQVGKRWEAADVGTGASGAPTSIAVDVTGVHHVTWQAAEGLAYASDAGGDFADETLPEDTAGGVQPKVGAGAEGTVYLAWYDPQDTELQMAVRAEEEPLLAVPSPEETGGGTAPAAECQPDGAELSITAQNIAFDKECLAAPAGQPFTIEFANEDQGTPHNVGIYDAPGGTELFQGETVTGPTTTTYEVDAIDQEGELHFQCDVHPTTMTGTFVVAAEGEGGADGGGGGGGGG
jgi:hypothetical protein